MASLIGREQGVGQIEAPGEHLSPPVQQALDRTMRRSRKMLFSPRRKWIWTAATGVAIVLLIIASPWSTNRPLTPTFEQRAYYVADGTHDSAMGRRAFKANAPKVANDTPENGSLIVRTAELALTANDFQRARGDMERILNRHGGYIAFLNVNSAAGQARSLRAVLRAPATQLDGLLSDLRRLGHVDSESQKGEDVTRESVDLDARLANARETERRLTQLLRERTGSLKDVLAVEEQLDDVRGQIEQMEAERKSLSDRIAFATVNVTIGEIYEQSLSVHEGSTFTALRNAAVEGYRRLLAAGIGSLRVILSYGPILLMLAGVLFLPGRVIWRRRWGGRSLGKE